jgi:diguanylate cyclase (GGDEF)-like protein
LLLDLDGFKGTNDAFGHHIGDQVLCAVAERLRAAASDRDLVGRLGGDEFAIVLSEEGSGAAHALAQRVLDAVRQPIVVAGVQLRVAGSIGLAHSPKAGGSVSELMRSADLAMFHAKAGSLGVAEFDKTIDAGRSDRLELLAALQRALEGNELELHYQPRIALGDGRVVGWEALLRWRHPGLGLIQPGRFLPTVEASDLIHPLSRWVADTAIAQAQQWRRQGVPGCIAINLSARNLLDARWPSLLRQLLQQHGLPPGLLEIEITETAFVQDTALVEELLRGIEAIGIRLAVDDYGVGFSSLSYLKRFPIHALKIDRIFIADLVRDRQDAAIVHSTIELAHELGLEVTAEGVEDEATHEFLAQLGCDSAQGYHFAHPMPESDVANWLRTRALELRSECVKTLSRTSQWAGFQS